jgi:predicted nucleotidyltransferase
VLSKLFSSKQRIKVLEYVLYRNSFRVTEVSKELNLSKGFVSEYLDFLYKNKIIKKDKEYKNAPNPLSNSIKLILNINKINISKIKKPFINGIGIYGSWADGTNMYGSDLDIWLKTDKYPDENEIAKISKIFRKITNSEVQILVLTPSKLDQIKKDKPFFSSLYHNSITLWGEQIE